MKIQNIIFTPIFLFFLISCEETVTNVDLPYVEQLVINCILDNGELVNNVTITRTLPPLEIYDIEKAQVKDAKVIISDGTKNYELFFKDGYYHSNDLIAESGKTYSLKVEWNGKIATATTFVPYPNEISEIKWDVKQSPDMGGTWYEVTSYAFLKPSPNVVYNSGYTTESQHGGYSSLFNIARETDVDSNGFCKVIFINGFYFETSDITEIKKLFQNYVCIVHSYDAQFYPFFITRYNGQSGDEIFGGSSNNIQWNIKGDGIGLFIGRATTFKKI